MKLCYTEDMKLHMEKFSHYLSDEKNLSKNTLDSYNRDIKQYLHFVSTYRSDTDWKEKSTVFHHLRLMKSNGKAAATIHRNLVSLRAFFQFLLRNQLVDSDPTADLESPKIDKKEPVILSVREVESILQMPDMQSSMGIRDKAMMELLYATGLKVSELVALDESDIDLNTGFIYCRSLGRERIVPIGASAEQALVRYSEERISYFLRSKTETAFFLNNHGQRLSRQGFWKILKKYSVTADVNKEITPHTLRHSFANHLLASGADIHAVKEMLGHSDITSTQVYKPNVKLKLKEVYMSHHPRA